MLKALLVLAPNVASRIEFGKPAQIRRPLTDDLHGKFEPGGDRRIRDLTVAIKLYGIYPLTHRLEQPPGDGLCGLISVHHRYALFNQVSLDDSTRQSGSADHLLHENFDGLKNGADCRLGVARVKVLIRGFNFRTRRRVPGLFEYRDRRGSIALEFLINEKANATLRV
jgi:hypothetical protein